MSAQFNVPSVDSLRGTSAVPVDFHKPKEIAVFAYDDNHQYKVDAESVKKQLHYYKAPQWTGKSFHMYINPDKSDPSLNLNRGFGSFRHYQDTTNKHLDDLLKTLMLKEKETGKKTDANFITWRGMMTKLLTAQYDPYSEFSMKATLFDGTIFIEEDWEAKQAEQMRPQNNSNYHSDYPLYNAGRYYQIRPSQAMMQFWGYKFETLYTSPVYWPEEGFLESRHNHIVSNHSQYCSIVETGLNDMKMVIGGEVDCVLGSKYGYECEDPNNWVCPPGEIPYVELKTADQENINPANGPWKDKKWELKVLRFWAQSALLGVPIVVLGYRDQNGILLSHAHHRTDSIPSKVMAGLGSWDPNHSLALMQAVLRFLKGTRGEGGVYRLSRRKGDRTIQLELVEEGTGDIVSPEFVSWRQELAAKAN
jgi:RAT1-interacting protein